MRACVRACVVFTEVSSWLEAWDQKANEIQRPSAPYISFLYLHNLYAPFRIKTLIWITWSHFCTRLARVKLKPTCNKCAIESTVSLFKIAQASMLSWIKAVGWMTIQANSKRIKIFRRCYLQPVISHHLGCILLLYLRGTRLQTIRRGVYKNYTDNKFECVSMLFGSSPILPWKRKLPRWRMAAKRVKIIQQSSSENINTWTKTDINKFTFQKPRENPPKRGGSILQNCVDC